MPSWTGSPDAIRSSTPSLPSTTARPGVDSEVLEAYDRAVDALVRLGARVEQARLPRTFQDYLAGTGRIIAAEAYHVLGPRAEDPALPLDSHVRARILQGRGVTARDYLEALHQQAADQRGDAAATADLDALLTPTTRTPAIPLTDVDEGTTSAYFTRMANYLRLCASAGGRGQGSQTEASCSTS